MTRNLQLSDEQAKKLFPTAAPDIKAILVDTFGEPFFKVRKPFNEILTLDDVFEAAGADPNDPQYHEGPADEIGYRLAKLLPKALNPADWVLNWDDDSQYKWGPWFYFNSPGFRFNDSYFSYSNSNTTGGSRHAFATRPISDHAGKQFMGIYKQWLA